MPATTSPTLGRSPLEPSSVRTVGIFGGRLRALHILDLWWCPVGHVPSWVGLDQPALCCDIAGDEYADTRGGNNNWYGHDGELTWFDWEKLEAQRDGYFRFYRCSTRPGVRYDDVSTAKRGILAQGSI